MKKLGNVLYIISEGSYLHCENKSICVMAGGTEKTRIPAHTIEAIICLCNTSVSTPFIDFCSDNGISLSFHSDNGSFFGRVYGQVSGNLYRLGNKWENKIDILGIEKGFTQDQPIIL